MSTKKIFIIVLTIIIFGGTMADFLKIKTSYQSLAQILFQEQTETVSAIEKAKKSVVSIIKTQELTEIVVNQKTGQTQIDSGFRQISGGSGIIVESNGLILTNKHVVSSGDDYSVILDNGEIYKGKVVARDPLEDLALLKIEGKNFPVLTLADSRYLKIGQTVMAIGYSLGRYQNSVTKGIISGLNRDLTASDPQGKQIVLTNIIQTDAAINNGNSGGALIDLNGQVVGINTAVEMGENVGFAITSNSARKAIRSYKKYGKIIRPKLGVRYIMINPTLAKFLGLPRKNGAWIHSGDKKPTVLPNSPAERAGLKEGDIIFEVNAIKVTDKLPLAEIISFYDPGQTIGFKVQRGEKIIILKATLGKFE